ncbi:hypothetical protein DERF_009909 [Dermatophagoides farinae]|uniref:Uncharacterized protein n=1 Tax=Dermatophagoides farinae TaxID=6954 RepID=A0A922L303_DERFA|nr:hypothetical protein DERF_009909 [Dermatophagoides farinae]
MQHISQRLHSNQSDSPIFLSMLIVNSNTPSQPYNQPPPPPSLSLIGSVVYHTESIPSIVSAVNRPATQDNRPKISKTPT